MSEHGLLPTRNTQSRMYLPSGHWFPLNVAGKTSGKQTYHRHEGRVEEYLAGKENAQQYSNTDYTSLPSNIVLENAT